MRLPAALHTTCRLAALALCAVAAGAADGDALNAPIAKVDWFKELFTPFTMPLWIGSLILLTLVFERARALRARLIYDQALADGVAEAMGAGNVERALNLCQASPTVVGRAWALGLQEFVLGGVGLVESLRTQTVLALKPLRRNLLAITTIGVVSPLFGLFGTVIGIIISFNQMGAEGGADKSKLAGAIGVALFTTAGGIILAIPSIICSRFFAARIGGFADRAEASIHRINFRHAHHVASSATAGAARAM